MSQILPTKPRSLLGRWWFTQFNVEYTGFSLSKGEEFIDYSEGAEQCFKDHGFQYKVKDMGGQKRLVWTEFNSVIELPFEQICVSEEKLFEFLQKYQCKFELAPNEQNVFKIKFL